MNPPPVPPPLPPSSPEPTVPPRRKSRLWLWITLVVLLFCGGGGWGLYEAGKAFTRMIKAKGDAIDGLSAVPLEEARRGHVTAWTTPEPTADERQPAEAPPADGPFQLIRYPAPLGTNAAYVTPDPGDGKRHTAVVWAKGGFGGIGDFFWKPAPVRDDQSARAFREAGLVLLCPSWRGENDNPGRFESFYGEVDDLLAAVRHAKSLPYVDPERVYLAGHSTGGTLVLLAAVASGEFRAAFSFGGAPDMASVMEDGEGYGNAPYPPENTTENELRSAIRFTPFITRPTFYFEGERSSYGTDARRMARLAKRRKVPFEAFELPGDHFSILAPVTKLVAEKMAADTGPVSTISFNQRELERAVESVPAPTLASVLADWQAGRGELEALIEAAASDLAEVTERDRSAVLLALTDTVKTGGEGAAGRIAALASVWETHCAADDEKEATSADPFLAATSGWMATALRTTPLPTGEAAAPMVQVLAFLSRHPDESTLGHIASAARAGLGTESGWWRRILAPEDAGLRTAIVTELGRELPHPALAGALAASANNLLLSTEGDGPKPRHPLDSAAGDALLGDWLKASPVHESAYVAAVSLALVSREIHDKHIDAALNHPDADVALEAAWADARHGGAGGLAALQKAAVNDVTSSTAVTYMRELKLDDKIPPAALEPAFAARAEMIRWLAHPQELGAPPKTIELFDTRELFWPPAKEKRTLWLFRFTHPGEEGKPDVTDYGMTGSGMTWSFFDERENPTAEHLYAMHCAAEFNHRAEQNQGDDPVDEVTPQAARVLLEQGNPGMFPADK